MKALLTSSGIKNSTIHDALVDLLDKPIAESNALFIPTAIYPFPGGSGMAWKAICGKEAYSRAILKDSSPRTAEMVVANVSRGLR